MNSTSNPFSDIHGSSAWLKSLVESMPQMIWRADDTGSSRWNSPQYLEYTGQTAAEAGGDGWLSTIHAEDINSIKRAWIGRHLSASIDLEIRIRSKYGSYRWFRSRALPIVSTGGEVIEWVGTSTDINEMVILRLQHSALVCELQHRTRNIIAVAHAISMQILRSAKSLEQYGEAYEHRLDALSRVQGLIAKSARREITVREIIISELNAVVDVADCDQIKLTGQNEVTRESMIQPLFLAVHELTTNALKYGALSTPEGLLNVSWHEYTELNHVWLCIIWRENGINVTRGTVGSTVGYGTVLIEDVLPKQMGAKTRFDLYQHALVCQIDIPSREVEL